MVEVRRLTASEVAKLLQVDRTTVWRIPLGQLYFETSPRGGRRSYRLVDVERFARDRMGKPSLDLSLLDDVPAED